MFPPRPEELQICNNSWGNGKTFVLLEVERVVLRKGAWLPRSFTLNALVMETARPRAIGRREDAPAPASSSEKPIHLWLRPARGTRATTAVAAAVSAATIQNEGVRDFWGKPEKSLVSLLSSVQEPTAQRRAINSESFRESLSTERY